MYSFKIKEINAKYNFLLKQKLTINRYFLKCLYKDINLKRNKSTRLSAVEEQHAVNWTT